MYALRAWSFAGRSRLIGRVSRTTPRVGRGSTPAPRRCERFLKIDHLNDAVRLSWSLGPASGPLVAAGINFCALAPDGRPASVVGFIDKMPS
jgi:hypothetical protein